MPSAFSKLRIFSPRPYIVLFESLLSVGCSAISLLLIVCAQASKMGISNELDVIFKEIAMHKHALTPDLAQKFQMAELRHRNPTALTVTFPKMTYPPEVENQGNQLYQQVFQEVKDWLLYAAAIHCPSRGICTAFYGKSAQLGRVFALLLAHQFLSPGQCSLVLPMHDSFLYAILRAEFSFSSVWLSLLQMSDRFH